jgi:DNA-binding MarR family transcriptional regulator
MHLSQPTVTGILGRLEQRKLIVRERSATDRRNVIVAATEAGRQLAEKAPPLLRDRFRHELDKLGSEEQAEILAMLNRVAGMMQAPSVSDTPYFFAETETGASKTKKPRPRKPRPSTSADD